MKKTYIKPVIETMNFGIQQILASSLTFDGDTGGGLLGDESADEGIEAMSLNELIELIVK